MASRRYWIPSTSALLAFESTARHGNFSRAAEELNTSQSAISRHIATLEARLGTRLFQRDKRKSTLTAEGEHYYRAVVSSLENLRSAAMAIANAPDGRQVTIACTHEVSHLYMLPLFDRLQQAIGDDTQVRIMTYDYDHLDTMLDPRVDLILSYRTHDAGPADRVVALRETVRAVCSPGFRNRNNAVLSGPVSGWGGLTFLNLTKRNRGWANWEDWFDRVGHPGTAVATVGLDNYVYLLEAATAGKGLALGWKGMVERYLEAGSLVPIGPEAISFDHPLHAVLTPGGRDRVSARRALAFFGDAGAA